jgi:hypothetical protein
MKEAASSPSSPPTSASSRLSSRKAHSTAWRRKPSARSVAISPVRLATAAYMVIMAPTMAPTLKMADSARPSTLMKIASPRLCSS